MGSGQPSLRVPGSSLHSEEHAAGDFDALGDCAALAAPATNSTWPPPLRTSGNSGNSPNSSPARTQSPPPERGANHEGSPWLHRPHPRHVCHWVVQHNRSQADIQRGLTAAFRLQNRSRRPTIVQQGRTRPMDDATLSAYDRDATAFANDWDDAQPPPSDLHAVVRQFFSPGPTADVGCGSGRDAAWLNACGYPTKGFDASEGLLAEARRRHPQIHFSAAILPGLDGIAESSFANVL